MAKKKVEVNEDMLKDIMVGDIPVFGRERPNYQEPKVIETEDSDTDSDEGTEAVASSHERSVRKQVHIKRGIL